MKESDFNITIVGLGLIGGSFAKALKELKFNNIWGVDINEDSLKYAMDNNIIDKGYKDPKIPLSNSDIVIMCLYPELTIKFIKENINHFKENTIITDTAGIKEEIVEDIFSFLPKSIDFIGGHPMAGSEKIGIQHSSSDIFKRANYIITPTENNKLENINILEEIITKIGFKNIERIDYKRHDEIIAYTSQLPHILALVLKEHDFEEEVNLFTGGSYRDATRVANMNTCLWSELFIKNSENLVRSIEQFERTLSEIKEIIKTKDKEILDVFIDNKKYKRGEAN